MDEDTKRWYLYLLDVYGKAKAAIILAESILQDYDEKSNMREMQIVLIDALYHSAAINVNRIFDKDKDALGIRQFHNKFYGSKATEPKPKFKCDKQAEERLRMHRNKLLAHSDKSTLSADIIQELPLYIGDLNALLKSTESELFPLAKEILGTCIAGRNTKTGEWDFSIARQVKTQYGIYKNMLSQYRRMETYMRENCPGELLRIYYTKEEADDGQP